MTTIIIKPNLGVNPGNGSCPELHWLTWVKPGKLKKKLSF